MERPSGDAQHSPRRCLMLDQKTHGDVAEQRDFGLVHNIKTMTQLRNQARDPPTQRTVAVSSCVEPTVQLLPARCRTERRVHIKVHDVSGCECNGRRLASSCLCRTHSTGFLHDWRHVLLMLQAMLLVRCLAILWKARRSSRIAARRRG